MPQPYRGYEHIYYCEKCGAELVNRKKFTGRFDLRTGARLFHLVPTCPRKALGIRGLFDGHTKFTVSMRAGMVSTVEVLFHE